MVKLKSRKINSYLKQGDELIVISVSSPIDDEKKIQMGIKLLEEWGLKYRADNQLSQRWGYLAGTDEWRNNKLNPKIPVQLTTFARGGWGAARLLELSQSWREGWIVGYSDVTSILLARLAAGFNGCIHGPLINTLANEPEWSQERLRCILFGDLIQDIEGETWSDGIAEGPLVVANLTVATHLIGTAYLPKLKGAILVLEDVGEAPYRVDRMLTQWRLCGLLHDLAGIGFGQFTQCTNPIDIKPEETFSLEDVLKERTSDLGIPVIGNLPIGHCCGNAAMPLGRNASLNGTTAKLCISPELQ